MALALVLQGVSQVLVVVLEVFRKNSKANHVLLVDGLLPLEESLREALLVEVDQSKLDSAHGVFVESDILLPDTEPTIHDVLISLHEVSEHLSFVFLVGHLDELLSLSL